MATVRANVEIGSESLDSKTKTFHPYSMYSKVLSEKLNTDDKSDEVCDPNEPRSRIGLEQERYRRCMGGMGAGRDRPPSPKIEQEMSVLGPDILHMYMMYGYRCP